MKIENLNKYFDHTLLKPNATKAQITTLCEQAKANNFATVCVNPYWVSYAASLLKGSEVGIATVIGFPLGATSTFSKVEETKQAIKDGATEVDMVLNIGAMLDEDYQTVESDIAQVKIAAGVHNLKVILETGFLNNDQIIKASELSLKAKADFVKTSTGFGPRGASVEDVKLMKAVVKDSGQVKASGGIRTLSDTLSMIEAGATRIGTSGSVAIMEEYAKSNK